MQGQIKALEVAMNNPGKRNTHNKNNNNGKKNLNEEKGKKSNNKHQIYEYRTHKFIWIPLVKGWTKCKIDFILAIK